MKIKKIFLSGLLITVLLFAFGGAPAFAADCQAEITATQDIVANAPISTSSETLTQAKILIEEAISLCAAGDNDASLLKLNEAKLLIAQ